MRYGGGYGGGGYGRGNGGGYGGGGGQRQPFQKKDNEGRLFEEANKQNQNSPDFSGYIVIDGQEIKISGWGKSGPKGFSINLKVKRGNRMQPDQGGYGGQQGFQSRPQHPQAPRQDNGYPNDWDNHGPSDGSYAPPGPQRGYAPPPPPNAVPMRSGPPQGYAPAPQAPQQAYRAQPQASPIPPAPPEADDNSLPFP